MKNFTKLFCTAALFMAGAMCANAQEDEVYDFDASFYHQWDEVSGTANDLGDGGGGVVLNEEVDLGGVIWGNLSGAVPFLYYANITDYSELRFEGTPGATLRIMCNRTTDEGPIYEIKPTFDEEGKLTVKISDLKFCNTDEGIVACDFVCLQSIKVPASWAGGTMPATVTSIQIVKPGDPLSIPKEDLKNVISTANFYSSYGKTETSWNALTSAVSTAQSELNSSSATVTSLQDASAAITSAIEGLELTDEFTSLTADMYLKYDDIESPGAGESVWCSYDLHKAADLPYGDGNVPELSWADLSAYDQLIAVVATDIKPRFCINRMVANGQQGATPEESQMLDINPNNDNLWSTEAYLTFDEENNAYILNVRKIVEDYGICRLHSIKKQGWGAGVIVTDLLLHNGDIVTGIAEIEKNSTVNSGVYYDLQGRRVAQPAKGLYIVNGKKFVK